MFRLLLLFTADFFLRHRNFFIFIKKIISPFFSSFLLFIFIIILQFKFATSQWPNYEAVSKRLSDRCDIGEFDCALGDTCIPLSKFRDGEINCLDGSDEFCYPGQIKCGTYCVELKHLGECLANPKCENFTILPSYCKLLKTKLCHFENALPCKGYGECVLRKWLMDGKRDCLDGSDEDKDYVRLLTSCLYPPKPPSSNIPNNGFIPQQPNGNNGGGDGGGDFNIHNYNNNFPPSPSSPHLFPSPPSLPGQPQPRPQWPNNNYNNNNNQYPGASGSYATTTTTLKPEPPEYPWKPLPPLPTDPYLNGGGDNNNELVPINPFVRVPLTLKPPNTNNNGENAINPTRPSNFGSEPGNYDGGGGENKNHGLPTPNFGQNGVESGGGVYGSPMTPIIPINKFTKPPYPFESGSGGPIEGETGEHGHHQTWPTSTEKNDGWVDIVITKIPPPTNPPTPHSGDLKQTHFPPWNPHQIIVPDNFGNNIFPNQPQPVIPTLPPSIPIIPTSLTKPTTTTEKSPFFPWNGEGTHTGGNGATSSTEHTHHSHGNSHGGPSSSEKPNEIWNPNDEWLIAPIGGSNHRPTTKTHFGHQTNHPWPQPLPTYFPPPTRPPTPPNPIWPPPHFRTRTTPPPRSSTTPKYSEHLGTVEAPIVVSDPYLFISGLNTQLTTSTPPKTLNCTEKIKKAASELVPNPMCECPAGQMKNKQNQCVRAEISTFRARLMHLCKVGVRDNFVVENEPQILLWKLATAFDYPLCVRKADDIIIFNTVCNGCEFSDLIDRYAMNNDLSDIDVKLSELQKSGCYEFVINDCDEKSECIPDGLRYKCKCLPGTTDRDGTGKFCDGVVIANECVKFLGLCVLFWVLLLLLSCILFPIIGYLLWKYCKHRNYKVFDKFTRKKKHVEISSATPRGPGNIESRGSITGVTTETSAGQWESNQWGRSTTTNVIPTITHTTATTPRSTPLNQLIPADEYSIMENEDDDDKDSSKGSDVASIASTKILNKPVIDANRAVTTPDRRSSTESRSATPTIWETYKILGQQYISKTGGLDRRKSSTQSLELLIRRRQEEEFKKRSTAMSLPEVDIPSSSKPPPLTKRRGSKDSIRSGSTNPEAEQAAKLAAMLGVDTSTVSTTEPKDVSILPVAGEPPTAEVATIQERRPQIPEINLGSVPSTPEIRRAAESTVNDALKNVMGPLYDGHEAVGTDTNKPLELKIDERLQTTTKVSPIGSREDLPIIGKDRPRSSASIRSRSALPNPTIDSPDISEELDKVVEALSELPPLPVLKLDKKQMSKTLPSTSRSSKTSFDLIPKSARSLSSEKSLKFSDGGSPTRTAKTISSSMKEKPPIERKRTKSISSRKSVVSDEISGTREIVKKPTTKSAASSPTTSKKFPPRPKPTISVAQKPSTSQVAPILKSRRLPPLLRQPSSTSLRPKKFSSNPSTRQLSNISEKSDGTSENLLKNLPHSISLPNTSRSGNNGKSSSKLPRLVDAKKASQGGEYNYFDEPNYILADLDLDLPGPFMVPGSLEDLRKIGIGTSKLPRLHQNKNNFSTQSAPSSERLGGGGVKQTEKFSRQESTKSDEFWKMKKLPPIDVDLEDDFNRMPQTSDFDIDIDNSSRTEKPTNQRHSTIARKIASRKAAGQNYPIIQRQISKTSPKSKDKADDGDIDLVYEYRRPHSHSSHVHDGCIQNQPPWNSTPLKDGELEQIPLDWNLSRSSSLMSFTDRKTQSFTDLHKISSMKITTKTNLNKIKSHSNSSLTNVFHFKAKIKNNNDVDNFEWVKDIKKSLVQTNSWLDYD